MADQKASPRWIRLEVDGATIQVASGTTVAAAVWNQMLGPGSGAHGPQSPMAFRRSVSGALRAPLCGMGICYECRLEIDGRPQERSCMVLCRDGMVVRTDPSSSKSGSQSGSRGEHDD